MLPLTVVKVVPDGTPVQLESGMAGYAGQVRVPLLAVLNFTALTPDAPLSETATALLLRVPASTSKLAVGVAAREATSNVVPTIANPTPPPASTSLCDD